MNVPTDKADYEPLFATVLGGVFRELPLSLQQFHGGADDVEWAGKVSVQAASNIAGKIVARVVGFPERDLETTARVAVRRSSLGEDWRRTFGQNTFHSFISRTSYGGASGEGGAGDQLICERFGWLTFTLSLVWQEQKLWFVTKRWRLGRVPLPKLLLPGGRSFETEENGQFVFDVTIQIPLLGRIVRYRGTLEPPES